MDVSYTSDITELTDDSTEGFFVGWPSRPPIGTLLSLLTKSDYRIIALEGKRAIGFITAITDGTLAAYIPFLEVLPEYKNRGIGTELAKQMLELLQDFYMIDLLCDSELQPFYERLGMRRATGMMLRNFDKIRI